MVKRVMVGGISVQMWVLLMKVLLLKVIVELSMTEMLSAAGGKEVLVFAEAGGMVEWLPGGSLTHFM